MIVPRCSIVIPARNEAEGILTVLERLKESMNISYECIIVVDDRLDSTCEYITNFGANYSEFRLAINNREAGPAGAIKYGISVSKSPVVVVTMADGSDDPRIISDLVRLVERGVAIACASRYMPGGQQVGAPAFKGALSRIAGLSLYFLGRVGTHDSTNSFKAYKKEFLETHGIDSKHGFEIAIELVAKAKRHKLPVAELPTIWLERNVGTSSFKLWNWLPSYFHWYLYAFGIGK
jgi:dolichol-phosphate mannosyltransferase